MNFSTSRLTAFFVFSVFLATGIFSTSYSQWSPNTAVNLQVCDTTGSQELTKISYTSDGGCYISWFDTRSGSYAVYLQRLNAAGVKQFAPGGLLVSGNPQSTSLVDYDLITDDSNNAVIVFTDTRNGSSINPFAYRISGTGTFMWGANGVTLTDSSAVYQANPKVVQTSDGNFIISWIYSTTPNKIAMQKLSPTGVKLWNSGNPMKIASGISNENFTYPAMVRSDNGSIIMMWSGYTGSFITAANYKLYTQKYSSTGLPSWGTPQDTVYSLGKVSGFYVPRIASDGNNGALYAWEDDRNSTNMKTAYVQRINSTGVKQFPINGTAGMTTGGVNNFDPAISYSTATGETYMFWKQTNSLQSLFGVYGQKFNASGVRQWGNDGIAFKTMDQNSFSSLQAYSKDTSVVVNYLELLFGGVNGLVKSFKVNKSGGMAWGGSILTPSSITSEKERMACTMNPAGFTMLSWSDKRNDGGGIYAQNLSWAGNFGGPNGVEHEGGYLPLSFKLEQNYPNPFNPSTSIKYQLSKLNYVTLKVYDVNGKLVKVLVNESKAAGEYAVTFDGAGLSSGVYFYELKAGEFSDVKSMALIK